MKDTDFTFPGNHQTARAMIYNFTQGTIKTMKIIKSNEEISSWHLPYYFLAVTSIELFGKLVLLIKDEKNKKDIKETEKILRRFNHNLDELYSDKGVGKEFLSLAEIYEVKKIRKGNQIYHYDFYTNQNQTPTRVYHPESLRYGIMSGERSNNNFIAFQSEQLLELCEKIEDALRTVATTKLRLIN